MNRLVLLASALAIAGCAAPEDRPATWSYLHTAIVQPSCATSSCHSQLAEVAGLDLSDPDESYRLLIDGQYVIPGDLRSALLFHLDGEQAELMPPDAPLPEGDVVLFERWILEGALR